jgi:hypothetical protein
MWDEREMLSRLEGGPGDSESHCGEGTKGELVELLATLVRWRWRLEEDMGEHVGRRWSFLRSHFTVFLGSITFSDGRICRHETCLLVTVHT